MKEKVKAFFIQSIKFICFLAGLFVVLALLNDIMIFKQEDGTNPVRNYYDLPNDTVDVLIIGTSHAGMNISTKTLWNEYGIAGYRFWGSIQPIWNSYFYLEEALKYQTPKVVVLDIHSLSFVQDYGIYAVQVKNTAGLNYSPLRLEAVKASAPEDKWADLFLGFPTYHSRYNELQEDDFTSFPWQKHQELQVLSSEESNAVYSFSIAPSTPDIEPAPLGEKEEKYFRMFLQTCKDHNLPVELVVCPYEISEAERQKYKRTAEIAAEYGLSVTDFNENYQDYGIDPTTDYLDPGHFNRDGLPKYARAIADLLSKYDLPDRRKDANHIWNRVKTTTLTPVFSLAEQLICDGKQDYKECDIQLFQNPLASWSLFTDFDVPENNGEDQTILSSCEETSMRSGLLIWLNKNGELKAHIGLHTDITIPEPGSRLQLAVVKTGQEFRFYQNGVLIETRKIELSELLKHELPLILGCELNENGQHSHFGKTQIHDLQIYDEVPDPDFIAAWVPSDLPIQERLSYVSEAVDSNILVSLNNRFEGDGEKIIDTDVRLYEDPERSWTLFSRIDPTVNIGDIVYFACFSEEEEHYRGLLVRKFSENEINIVYGMTLGLNLEIPTDRPSTLAIAKDRSSYTFYLNGEKVCEDSVSISDPYDGDLMIGCELDADGNVFRRSGTTIYNFEVYDGLLSEKDILAWDPAPLDVAPKSVGSDVTYKLAAPFTGNGKDAFIDTGMQLYDNAEKDWTISFTMDQVNTTEGAVISCYDETPGNYHGLLLRKMEDNRLVFITGIEYTEYAMSPATECTITIVKSGLQYRIYLNKELIVEKESRCPDYLGNLYIGCERDQYGKTMRYSNVRIRELSVINRALKDEEVTAK